MSQCSPSHWKKLEEALDIGAIGSPLRVCLEIITADMKGLNLSDYIVGRTLFLG